MNQPTLDVFQPGLRRGAARLPFAPHKRYFYVEHPTEGWRVYLRSCCFIHDAEDLAPTKFVVVKRYGANENGKVWEPPKGQMEGKDGLANPTWSIMKLLTENIYREVEEEAKIRKFDTLNYTNIVLQGCEKDYPPNTFFQYHCFSAIASQSELQSALAEFEWLNAHPLAFSRLRKDKREKDAIAWFDPRKTQVMGKWSPSLVAMYLRALEPSP